MTADNRVDLCPLCGGDGWVTEDELLARNIAAPEGLFIDGHTEVCPLCDGDGREPASWGLGGWIVGAMVAAVLWALIVGAYHVWKATHP